MQQTEIVDLISFDPDRKCQWEHDPWISGFVKAKDNPTDCRLIADPGKTLCQKHELMKKMLEGE
jgi:hypothetical protein